MRGKDCIIPFLIDEETETEQLSNKAKVTLIDLLWSKGKLT